jgi:hypothetical protein
MPARGSLGTVLGVAVAVLAWAPQASATSGEFSLAVVGPGPQIGVAGSVSWTGCENVAPVPPSTLPGPEPSEPSEPPDSSYCGWIPYATIGPVGDCSSAERELPSLGPEVEAIWVGEERTDLGTANFEAADLPLHRSLPQLLCLSVIEVADTAAPIPCVPPGETVPSGWHCPYKRADYFYALDSKRLAYRRWCPRPSHLAPTRVARRCHRHRHFHRNSNIPDN